MHKVQFIRDNVTLFNESMRKRRSNERASDILDLADIHKALVQQVQQLQVRKNEIARKHAQLAKDSFLIFELKNEGQFLKNKISLLNRKRLQIEQDLEYRLLHIPNILSKNVSEGRTKDDNVIVRKFGKQRHFAFKARSHEEIGKKLGMLNLKTAAKWKNK